MFHILNTLENSLSQLRLLLIPCGLFLVVYIAIGCLTRSAVSLFGTWHRGTPPDTTVIPAPLDGILETSAQASDRPSARPRDDRLNGERRCRVFVEGLFCASFVKCRPIWLRTGRCLGLDMYNDTLKLAFEYDGAQYAVFTPFFHRTYEQFEYQMSLARMKDDICAHNGVTLIRIPYQYHSCAQDTQAYIMKELRRTRFAHMINK